MYLGAKAWVLEFLAKHLKSQSLQEKKHSIISNYLKTVCSDEEYMTSLLEAVTANRPDFVDTKTIWVFWYQGYDSMPDLVKKCYAQLNKMKGDANIVLLTRDNLKDFLAFPQFVYDRVDSGAITLTHYSDLIRFALLYLYGGFWIDATVWLTQPVHKEIFDSRYWTVRNAQPSYTISVSRYKWSSFLLYVGHAGDSFAKLSLGLMLVFWGKNQHLIDYLLVDYCMELASMQDDVKNDWDKILESNYHIYELIWHINDSYSETEWNKWCLDTFAYKLSYKVKIGNNIKSYYNKIILNQ